MFSGKDKDMKGSRPGYCQNCTKGIGSVEFMGKCLTPKDIFRCENIKGCKFCTLFAESNKDA